MTNRPALVVSMLLVASVIVAGCGKPSTSSPARVPQQAPDLQPQATRPLQEATTVLVTIQGSKFVPALVSARVGDTIKWTNNDSVAHSVIGGEFRSPNIAPGGTYQAVVTKAGTIDYTCGIHPDMKGQIQVEPAG
jgi:plastocyanin